MIMAAKALMQWMAGALESSGASEGASVSPLSTGAEVGMSDGAVGAGAGVGATGAGVGLSAGKTFTT